MRLDKWLWAARFFKTRTLSREAIQGGKVHLNQNATKAGKNVAIHDILTIQRGQLNMEVQVLALNNHRRPAPEAQQLYQETPTSQQTRESQQENTQWQQNTAPQHKPDKKSRRILRNLRNKG